MCSFRHSWSDDDLETEIPCRSACLAPFRQPCVPALCNLWHRHTRGHRPQGDCSCYVKKRVAFQIAQGESDAVRGYPVCMDQAALIFTVQEDEQSPPGKGESCTTCVLHCWPFPARHGTHPSAKSCLSLSHNSGTSSAFVRSHWCEGSDFTAQ